MSGKEVDFFMCKPSDSGFSGTWRWQILMKIKTGIRKQLFSFFVNMLSKLFLTIYLLIFAFGSVKWGFVKSSQDMPVHTMTPSGQLAIINMAAFFLVCPLEFFSSTKTDKCNRSSSDDNCFLRLSQSWLNFTHKNQLCFRSLSIVFAEIR